MISVASTKKEGGTINRDANNTNYDDSFFNLGGRALALSQSLEEILAKMISKNNIEVSHFVKIDESTLGKLYTINRDNGTLGKKQQGKVYTFIEYRNEIVHGMFKKKTSSSPENYPSLIDDYNYKFSVMQRVSDEFMELIKER